MHAFIIIHSVVTGGVYERQSSPLLKVTYRVLNVMYHGLKSDSSFRYVFMHVFFRCPVC